MITIRPEQMKALEESMRSRFRQDTLLHLRAIFPERTANVSDAQLLSFIDAGIERSAKYGVVIEADVQRYIEYMAIYGADFDASEKTAWAGAILGDRMLDGTMKMDRIDDYDLYVLNR